MGYFDETYFDPAYFDTGSTSGGHAPRRLVDLLLNDPDELLALI